MNVVLEIMDGPLAGRTVDLQEGQSVSVGRTAKSQLMLPHDNFLSGMHFLVENLPSGPVLRDCNSSNGTWVNGERIAELPVNEGDLISAGQTRFRIYPSPAQDSNRTSTVLFSVPNFNPYVTGPVPVISAEPPVAPEHQRVIDYLRMSIAPVYALIDAASEPAAPQLLASSGEPAHFLADGMQLGSLEPPQAYLTALTSSSALLPRLVREGWGKRWLVFFTCAHPFPEVIKHFRQLLFLQTVDSRVFRFRYFDPHFLQLFLAGANAPETAQFFGPVQSIVLEQAGDPARLLEFRPAPHGIDRRELNLR